MAEEINSSKERGQSEVIDVICPWIEGSTGFVYGRLYTGGTINIGRLFNPEKPSKIKSDVLYTFTEGPDAKTIRSDVELIGPFPKIPEAVYIITEGKEGTNILRVDRYSEVLDGLSSKNAGRLRGKLMGDDLKGLTVTIGSPLPINLNNDTQRVVRVLSTQATINVYEEDLPVDSTITQFNELTGKTKEVIDNFGIVPSPQERSGQRALLNWSS